MRAAPPSDAGPAGVYVHFPFCAIRCTYCDFPTVAGRDDRIEAYLRALEREIERGQDGLPAEADSVYFGGGTPSRMRPEQVRSVLRAVRRRFRLDPGAEITLEGNPESLTRERLDGYREAGVNRVSIGVQSLHDRVLRDTGRAHDAGEAVEAVRRARASGVDVGVDLIAGLPGEPVERWEETVARIADLGPDHVSVYLLETDKDTPLARAIRRGRIPAPDDDALADAYRATCGALDRRGLAAYEISSFARPGHASRHNVKYWTDAPYAGFGLGAHGYARGARRANRRDLDGYVADVEAGRDAKVWEDPWDGPRRLAEAVVMGLRMVRGIDPDELGRRYDVDVRASFAGAFSRAREAGVLVESDGRIALTLRGRLTSNELFQELIA